jgi:tRNA A-37 threonylcarbamoyl transferase component Bud32
MLMDTESLCQYLESNSISYAKVAPLVNGGVVNYIWRVTTPTARTSIIKHASHHLRINEKFLISVDRMDYEVHALRTIPGLLYASGSDQLGIQLPAVIRYDAERHVLQISDGGSRNLKSAYADPALDIQALGTRLGRWLAGLHIITSSVAILPIIKERFNNVTGKSIYRTNFNGLGASLEKFGYDRKLGERMNKKFGALLETDEVCLSHGDFWPANVIVTDSNSKSSSLDLTIIDWELTRIGNGATDVGQFAAEAWILETYSASKATDGSSDVTGGRGLVEAFLKAYLAERRLSDEDKLRVAAQFGTHIAYLPSVVKYPAGSRQPTEMVRTGNEILQMVDAGNITSLKGSPLGLFWATEEIGQ